MDGKLFFKIVRAVFLKCYCQGRNNVFVKDYDEMSVRPICSWINMIEIINYECGINLFNQC